MQDSDTLGTPSLELSAASLAQFSTFVTETLGIKMNASKLPMLQGRLHRRLRSLELESLEAYRDYLFENPAGADELQHFIDAVTTNKTDFFREPQHFEQLVTRILPELTPRTFDGRPASWTCRIWSAPCSSGEEPYTLAMVLQDYAARTPLFDFQLLATDISSRMLDHAQRAIYDADRIEPVPMPMRTRYLLRARDPQRAQVRIVPELRRKVTFRSLNFMDRDYRVRECLDVIFCRNVLIYFDKPTQEAVVRRLARHLRPDGYLFLGHSESLSGLDVPFMMDGAAVYRHVPANGRSDNCGAGSGPRGN